MNHHATLIQVEQLAGLMRSNARALLICDCTYDLGESSAGIRSFDAAHLPHAVYLHLSRQLSGPSDGRNGRHPLPSREGFAATIAELGATDETQIVAYDAGDGLFAARLWWLARWVGHEAVAVLDGGMRAWRVAGQPVERGASAARRSGSFSLRPPLVASVDFAAVRDNLTSGSRLVIDARAADRFRGENETLDPVGGHIPGARNRPYRDNLGADGRFKPAAELRADFADVIGARPASEVISQCGSGVTACHNLLAMAVAGMPGGALYGGSWSEWCAQEGAPIATGAA